MGKPIGALTIAASLAVVAASPAIAAAAPTVRVSADAREIYAGLPFSLRVAASGFDEEPEPAPPELSIPGCEVSYLGMRPQMRRSLEIVGNRRRESVEVTFVFHYRITPSKAGRYTIGALQVRQGRLSARSRPAELVARSVPKSGDMALRVVLPDRPVWVGETFEVFIDWYVARNPSRPSFRIPLFERGDRVSIRPGGGGGRTLELAAGADTIELAYTAEAAELDGREYQRLRFRALATPLEVGTIELESPRVIAELEVDRRIFARSELFAAEGEPRRLEVKPLPQAGKPASFGNAVGTGFSIDVQASRTVVRVGDPIELAITIRGDTPLAGMALPDLGTLLPPEHFAVPTEEPVGELSEDGRTKTFRVTARLESKDVREVPPVELAYFNPESGTYEAARSQPIALQVAGSAVVGSAQVVGGAGGGEDGRATVASLVGADLSLSSPGETLDRRAELGELAPALAAAYAIPLAALGLLWWRRRTRSARGEKSAVRERRRAIDALAASERPDNEVAGELAAALRTLHREVGGDRAELDELVAELEATAYNPRAGAEPLPEPLRRRCRELAARLAGDRGSRTRPGRGAAATLIALSLAGAVAVRAEDAGELDRARVVYREALATESEEAQVARFGEAAALLAAAVARTPDRPGLLTDWGNAALGARDLGRAALAYRRALALDRGDRRAARNLAWVRDSLPDWAPTPGDEGAIDSLLFWHRRWSVEGRHIGAALAFAATLLLLMPWGRRREPWLRRVAAIPALMFVGLLGSALLEPDRGGEAVVIEDGAVLRSADSPHAPAALERPLPAGLEVTVVEEREQWREIALADGRRGWLPRAAIERIEP